MLKKLIEKAKVYSLKVAMRKGGLILANLLASGTAAAWLTTEAQPYLIKYGPLMEKFGVHVTPEVLWTSICGTLATVILDAYGVQPKKEEEPKP